MHIINCIPQVNNYCSQVQSCAVYSQCATVVITVSYAHGGLSVCWRPLHTNRIRSPLKGENRGSRHRKSSQSLGSLIQNVPQRVYNIFGGDLRYLRYLILAAKQTLHSVISLTHWPKDSHLAISNDLGHLRHIENRKWYYPDWSIKILCPFAAYEVSCLFLIYFEAVYFKSELLQNLIRDFQILPVSASGGFQSISELLRVSKGFKILSNAFGYSRNLRQRICRGGSL